MSKVTSEVAYRAIRLGIRLPELKAFRMYLEKSYLIDLLHRLKVNCVFDVGANNGWFSHNLRKMGYRDHIISFEPIPENYCQLAKLTQGDDKWTAVNAALGKENQTKTFNVFGKPGEAAYSVFSSFHDINIDLHADKRQINVEIYRLDEIANDYLNRISEPRIFLKVDTQGHDTEVLKGAPKTLRKVVGLQSEISVTRIYKDTPHFTNALAYYEEC